MKKRFLGAIVGIAVAAVAAAAGSWTWTQFLYGHDVWLRNYSNGAGMFDYRLGGGGSIAQMRFIPRSFESLLSPTVAGEETDRVIQSTYWINNVTCGSGVPDARFNVDQAGNSKGTFSPTISLTRSNPQIDVYSVPQNEWYPTLDSCMQGKVSSFTRYAMQPNGVLQVRKVVRTATVTQHGVGVYFYDLYFEQWNPFNRSSTTFNAYALALDPSGNPTWWYLAGDNVPQYPNFPVDETYGYAVVYQNGAQASSPVVGVVYGTKPLQTFSTTATGTHVINSMDWNDGIGVLPALNLTGVESGSIIDYSYFLVPRAKSDASFTAELTSLVAAAPAPVLYGSSYPFSGELYTIVQKLTNNLNRTGTRTNHLASIPSS